MPSCDMPSEPGLAMLGLLLWFAGCNSAFWDASTLGGAPGAEHPKSSSWAAAE